MNVAPYSSRQVTLDGVTLLNFCKSRLSSVQMLYSWAEGDPARQADAAALAKELASDIRALYSAFDLDQASLTTVDLAWVGTANLPKLIAHLKRALVVAESACAKSPLGLASKARMLLFRLAAHRRMAFEVFGLTVALAFAATVIAPAVLYPDRAIRLRDLETLSVALGRYKVDNGRYPLSLDAGRGGWIGIGWSGVSTDWLPGLVPKYLTSLPRDPRDTDIAQANYVYRSDGTEYKLLVLSTDECAFNVWLRPKMNDRVRNTRKICVAYGYWTSGAVEW